MQRKDLDKQMTEVKTNLRNLTSDIKFADRLIDKMLSIKGQMMIEPTEVMIKTSDIDFSHQYGGFKVSRTSAGDFMFHVMGYTIIVSPYSAKGNSSLYEILSVICDLQTDDDEKTITEENRKVLDNLVYQLNTICTIPLTAFVNDDIRDILCDAQLSILNVLSKSLKEALMPEEKVKDAEFRENIETFEKIEEDIKKEKED